MITMILLPVVLFGGWFAAKHLTREATFLACAAFLIATWAASKMRKRD